MNHHITTTKSYKFWVGVQITEQNLPLHGASHFEHTGAFVHKWEVVSDDLKNNITWILFNCLTKLVKGLKNYKRALACWWLQVLRLQYHNCIMLKNYYVSKIKTKTSIYKTNICYVKIYCHLRRTKLLASHSKATLTARHVCCVSLLNY